MAIIKNYEFTVSIRGDVIVIEQTSSNTTERIFIGISQHAALVKGIGLAADEIYRKEKEDDK